MFASRHSSIKNDLSDHSLQFRPDIEGLRALAILPILLLHCGVGWLRGGYVGVDVFFVISGYLITRILMREMASGSFGGSFGLIQFYTRRCIRLLPALMVTLGLTALVCCLVMLPNELRDFAASLSASSVFSANFYFFSNSNYFAASSDAKPLVHLWSLAVEEQFYLIFPLCLHALAPRKWLIWALPVGMAASFAIGGWLNSINPQAAYYLIPSRAWELLGGALVAVCPWTGENKKLAERACLAALAVLGASCLLIKSSLPFPVPFALFPVAATMVLLTMGTGTSAAKLLSWPVLRYIGRISFPLYLVHRPIIAFFDLLYGSARSGATIVALIGGGLILAAGLYHLIELPSQRWARRQPEKRVLAWGAAALAGMAGTGLALYAMADRISPLPHQAAFAASYLGYNDTAQGHAQFDAGHCFVLPESRYGARRECLDSVAGRDNILLIGDSHAAQWSQAIRQEMPRAHLIQATAAGCRPLLKGKGLARCRLIALAGIQRNDWQRISTVILAGRWLPGEVNDLVQTAHYLAARSARVVVVGPMVEYDIDLPRLAALSLLRRDADLPARFRLEDRMRLDADIAQALKTVPVRYVSIVDAECDKIRHVESRGCRILAQNGAPLHFDHSHLTAAATREFLPLLLGTAAPPPHGPHDVARILGSS